MKRSLAVAATLVAAASMGVTASASSTRSGELEVTKECSEWTGAAGSFCTIVSSNLAAIKVGSKVVYASEVENFDGVYETDLVVDGPGNNNAFGHVVIDLPTGSGVVTLSGGTGVFAHFHAGPLVLACPPDVITCDWDGPYDFRPPSD